MANNPRKRKLDKVAACHPLIALGVVHPLRQFLDGKAIRVLRGCAKGFRVAYKRQYMWTNAMMTAADIQAAGSFAVRVVATLRDDADADFSPLANLERLFIICKHPGKVTLPASLRALECHCPLQVSLPLGTLQCAIVSDASAALIEQLSQCRALTRLTLRQAYDRKALAQFGLPPNLRKLDLAQPLDRDLALPDSISSLEIRADQPQLPATWPSALASLGLTLPNPTADPVVVPRGLRKLKLGAYGPKPVCVVLPEGLRMMRLLQDANVQPFGFIPDSLQVLEMHTTAHLLPEKPNRVTELHIHIGEEGEELDPDLVRKCPMVRVLRVECFTLLPVLNKVRHIDRLPLARVEELSIRLYGTHHHTVFDFGRRAPLLRRLEVFGSNNEIDVRACSQLTHLQTYRSLVDICSLPQSLESVWLDYWDATRSRELAALAKLPNLRSLQVYFGHAGPFHSQQRWKWDVSRLCSRLTHFRVAGDSCVSLRFENLVTKGHLDVPRRPLDAKSWIGIAVE